MGKAKKSRKFANGAKIDPLQSNRDPGDNLEENILSKDKPTHVFNYELNKVKTKKKPLHSG